jgi:hypothetical protein
MRILDPSQLPEYFRAQVERELGKQSAGSSAPRAGKYRNQRIQIGDETFDSKLEHACFQRQEARRAAGEIRWFLRQVSFPLPGGIRYRCDFLACLAAGGVEVIDAKGALTKEFVIKAKQMKAVHGIEVLLWTKKKITPFSQRLKRGP